MNKGDDAHLCLTLTNPTAPTGKLCVYEGYADNLLAFANRYNIYSTNGEQIGAASKFGGAIYGYGQNGAANFYAWGTWAVSK